MSTSRSELIDALDWAGRESSTATVMFHGALAARQGLSSTEEKALDVLLREGPLTHSQLCAATGLAPPTVTDLVGRLERKGYAARTPHPDDRRRVLVSADSDRVYADIAPLFGPWVHALHTLYESYDDAQLATIRDFLARAAALQQVEAERLTAADGPGARRR